MPSLLLSSSPDRYLGKILAIFFTFPILGHSVLFCGLTTSMRGGEYKKMKKVRQQFPVPLDALVELSRLRGRILPSPLMTNIEA